MEIEYCNFPDDALYDLDKNTWVRVGTAGIANVGITSVHAALFGRLTQIKFKPVGTILQRGQSTATIESARYFGAVRTPISGKLIEVNHVLGIRPKLANDSPYDEAWFARIQSSNESELKLLSPPKSIEEKIRSQIREL